MPCNSLSRPWEGGRCSQIVAETRHVRVSRRGECTRLSVGESWLVARGRPPHSDSCGELLTRHTGNSRRGKWGTGGIGLRREVLPAHGMLWAKSLVLNVPRRPVFGTLALTLYFHWITIALENRAQGSMKSDAPLKSRHTEILNSIVRAYIEDGEPVGSRTISKRRTEALSPASIRNVMADLADEGYLAQPHTSAGRVPTEKAFRFYVAALAASRIAAVESHRPGVGADPA